MPIRTAVIEKGSRDEMLLLLVAVLLAVLMLVQMLALTPKSVPKAYEDQ